VSATSDRPTVLISPTSSASPILGCLKDMIYHPSPWWKSQMSSAVFKTRKCQVPEIQDRYKEVSNLYILSSSSTTTTRSKSSQRVPIHKEVSVSEGRGVVERQQLHDPSLVDIFSSRSRGRVTVGNHLPVRPFPQRGMSAIDGFNDKHTTKNHRPNNGQPSRTTIPTEVEELVTPRITNTLNAIENERLSQHGAPTNLHSLSLAKELSSLLL
jgi:hypothetical protein